MGEIISIIPYLKKKIEEAKPLPQWKFNKLLWIKEQLSEEDYMNFLEAALDDEHYYHAEEEIQDIVDGFYDPNIQASI